MRHGWPSFAVVLWILVSMTWEVSAGARPIQRSNSPRVSPIERLNIAKFSLESELDVSCNREYQRLDEVCVGHTDRQACRVKNLRPFSKLAAVLRNGPSASANVVGELHAVLGFYSDYGLGYRLAFRPRDQNAKAAVWLESVGDWGYGVEIPGVRVSGTWIRLFGSPLPSDSWVDGRSSSFQGQATSIQGTLVSLPPLRATFPDGTNRPIAPGSYWIEGNRRLHPAASGAIMSRRG